MDPLGRPSDVDNAFHQLREVLGAPDRRGWRRHLRSRPKADPEADAELDRPLPRRRRAAALAALPLLGAAAVLLVSIARPPAQVRPVARIPPPSETSVAGPAAAPEAAPVPQQVWPGEEVTVAGGGEVRVGRQRWSVGRAGDLVVVGDWNCDRQPTPAVLRPATGGFYVFDGWASREQPVKARKVADVPRAIDAIPAGCGAAVVRTADGAERTIATEVPR